MAKTKTDAVNPTSEPDPRFEPANDAENAAAHDGAAPVEDEATDRQEEIQAVVKRMLDSALNYYEEQIEPDQAKATDYYHARPFGNEKDGRSKVVSSDVRDATRAQIPSLARIFYGPERQVEFRGRGPEDEAVAAQATDYINYVVNEDNPGYLTFRAWWKDALVRRLGVVKWWWDEQYRVESADYTGQDQAALGILSAVPGSEIAIIAQRPGIGPDGAPAVLYDVRVTRKAPGGCPKIACIPSEEFVYSEGSRELGTASMVAHVREVPADELIGMGIPKDIVEEAMGKRRRPTAENLDTARQINGSLDEEDEDDRDESRRIVLYAEAYALVDGDGDDIAELRRFDCVGPEFEITNESDDGTLGEVVDELPFAVFTPDPEPHTIMGLSNFDLLGDVQLIKSQILRGTLDSLAQTITPVTEVVTGEVNMGDLTNPQVAGLVRVRKPGMMREIKHSFVGPDALPILGYFDQIKEDRTGTSRAAAGLDADALQSSTKAAVAATLSGSQQQTEELARVFAEMALKPLYRGLLRLICKHQDFERIIRLRGKYVPIDPRSWDATMDVQVNVGLGQGAPEDRVNALAGIYGYQKELRMMNSPLVTDVEMRNTLSRAVELAGFRNSEQFFRPWGPDDEAQAQQQRASQPPPPDPTVMLAELEQQKAQFQAELDAQKLELDRWIAEREDDRARDKMARDFALEEMKIEHDHAAAVHGHNLQADVARDRAAQDADVKRAALATQAQTQTEAA